MQALDILKDLQRKYAERLRYSWPNEDVEKSCNASIKKINSIFSNDIENIDFNNTSQRDFLSNLLYKYLEKDDNKFSVKLIEQFSAWFFHCYIQNNKDTGNNIKLYQLSDKLILKKIFKLFDTVGVNKQRIGDNLMTSYLNLYKSCSQQFKKLLKSFVNHINIINNLDLYFDQELFKRQIQNTDIEKENYSEYLLTKLIRNKFINTKYFSDIWFCWVMECADVLSEKFIKNNIVAGFYPTVDLDQQKVILAYMANCVEQIQGDEDRKLYLMKNYLIPVIGNHNPIHIEYWNITDKELENSSYGKFLKLAPGIFRNYYISEFITIFFDALESTGGDEDRAIFWRKYKTKIKYFAIALKPAHRNLMKNYIVEHVKNKESVSGYLKILSDFNLHLRTSNSNTPAVLVLAFESVIIVEFSEKGNAMYVYRNNDESYRYYLKTDNKNTEFDFKNTNSPSFLGKLEHRGYWQRNFGLKLKDRFNIVP